ncbi:MAG: SLC13 family permease [Thermoprotei archaeon]|nr:SLC13 family permease [TACK group archaeon]
MSLPQFESLLLFLFVFGGVALRNVLRIKKPVWMFFLVGATASVLLGLLSPVQAYASVDLQVITFLFSMFVLSSGLKLSGLLTAFGQRLSSLRGWRTLAAFYLLMAAASTVLMNDPLAIVGTPLAIHLAQKKGKTDFPFLLALAVAVTSGSEMTPMGNPQNLLVAVESGVRAPVISFFSALAVPTFLNVIVGLLFVLLAYRLDGSKEVPSRTVETLKRSTDRRLAAVTLLSLVVTMAGLVVVNYLQLTGATVPVDISTVSLCGALVLLSFGGRERDLIQDLDWGVLVMFAGLFVVTQAMWSSGLVGLIAGYLPVPRPDGGSLYILSVSVLLSQLISNVPMVALYIPVMKSLGFTSSMVGSWAALAAGSTVAGNLTLMGAASNLIILEESEREGTKSPLDFWRFLKYGILITSLDVIILALFLR